MNLKPGISIYSVPELSIDALIEFAEEYDFNAIELWDSPLPKSNKRLNRYLSPGDKDLSVHGPLLNLGDGDALESNTLALRDSFERAGHWGTKTFVLHTGILKNGRTSEGIETAKLVINSNLEVLEKYGIMLCIENVGYLGDDLIRDFEQLAAFVDSFPKHLVGIVFDVSHANTTGRVETGINALRNRITLVHVSDNLGERDNHHMPLGKGNIDFSLLGKCSLPDNSVVIMEITPVDGWQENLLDSRRVLYALNLIE